MGQRLNIEIIDGDEDCVLANAYYHWSAYTMPAAQLAMLIIAEMASEDFAKTKFKNKVEMAVKLLECTGAGVRKGNDEETAAFKEEGLNIEDYKECVDRNEGFISISESGIKETRCYDEGRIQIDIEDQMICFGVISIYNPSDWMRWYGEESDNFSYLDLPVDSRWDWETEEFTFEEFVKFVAEMIKLSSKGEHSFYDMKSDLVVSFIE